MSGGPTYLHAVASLDGYIARAKELAGDGEIGWARGYPVRR
jgi:hypothetical protein